MYVSGGPLGSYKYYLTQFHTHEVSEHHFDGVAYPLEIHFVHKSNVTGHLAVLAFFFRVEIKNSSFISEFIDMCASEESHNERLDFHRLLVGGDSDQEHLPYMTYSGSLTTPPCSENVHWIIIETIHTVSRQQLKQFMGILPQHISNNRPIQDINLRVIRRYRPPHTSRMTTKKLEIIVIVLICVVVIFVLLIAGLVAKLAYNHYKRKTTKHVHVPDHAFTHETELSTDH
jgi:hypothetical protein